MLIISYQKYNTNVVLIAKTILWYVLWRLSSQPHSFSQIYRGGSMHWHTTPNAPSFVWAKIWNNIRFCFIFWFTLIKFLQLFEPSWPGKSFWVSLRAISSSRRGVRRPAPKARFLISYIYQILSWKLSKKSQLTTEQPPKLTQTYIRQNTWDELPLKKTQYTSVETSDK